MIAVSIVATIIPAAGRTIGAAAVPSTWTVAGVHPGAVNQVTDVGRTLWTLAIWDGRVYPGYGDWVRNTGPILIASFDPATGEFVEEWTSGTQNIWNYRLLHGRFYALAGDPRGTTTYAVRDETTPWQDIEIGPVTHALDVTALDTDLWMATTLSQAGLVWRSTDGGAVWLPALTIDPTTTGASLNGFFFIFAFGGEIYVQNSDWFNPTGQTSRVWDGGAWRDGPNLLPSGGAGWRPFPVSGGVVYLDRIPAYHGPGQLIRFDGVESRVLLPGETISDLFVDGDTLYALNTRGEIRRGSATGDWETIATAPAEARSLAVFDDRLYVGTTDGELLVLDESIATSRAVRLTGR